MRARRKRGVNVRPPCHVPFLFVPRAVAFEQRIVTSVANQAGKRGLAEMMDEGVQRADDLESGLFDSEGVIVVFEHPDAEAFVERADGLKRVPAQGGAKHGEHVDVRNLVTEPSKAVACEDFHRIGKTHPNVKITLLENLCLGFCRKLRKANRQMSVFE